MINEIGKIIGSNQETLLRMWSVSVDSGTRPLNQHSHINFEITLIEEGNGIYTVGDNAFPIEQGDVFVFASNEQHCVTQVGNQGLKMTNLHFEPRYIWGYSIDSLSNKNINFCFSHNKDFINRIPAKQSGEFCRLITEIKKEFIKNEPEHRLMVKSLLNLILIKLIREHNYAEENSVINRDRVHIVRRVIKHIDDHLCENLSLSLLAEIAGMTPNYFSTVFHDVSGITLWDYINSKRIDKAIMLLHENNDGILEIATACGFNNTANFNKAFKKVTGLTPSEHRKMKDLLM